MSKFALDTNILLYSHDESAVNKQNTARNLIVKSPIISTQVVSEYINAVRRIIKLPKEKIFSACLPNLKCCNIYIVNIATIQLAERLIYRYDFQIFDSIIVASALTAGCQTLYSEDMQHNMKIEDQMTIFNPFL
ncbi:ribonuclease VapC [Bacteroidia bacterium]|nr:ribonuclease VapC [Bacteroidia bacterium]